MNMILEGLSDFPKIRCHISCSSCKSGQKNSIVDLLRWMALAGKKSFFRMPSLNFSPNMPDFDCKICLSIRKNDKFPHSKPSTATSLMSPPFFCKIIVRNYLPKHAQHQHEVCLLDRRFRVSFSSSKLY